MKSFKIYLLEADYTRFLKKNRLLTKSEIAILNDFFKTNQEAAKDFEEKYGWQSKHPKQMTWQDFENFMMNYKSGRRRNLKNIKIPGKKGEDYWPIKLSNKNFIANIPLNWKTAQFMNSCKYGTINVNYCIGWPDEKTYWNRHVMREKKVPVYVADGYAKWVVMILPSNRRYEVWDKFNNVNVALQNKEPIPGFSIKKELLGPKKAKLYNEIRKEFYTMGNEKGLKEATIAYDKMKEDIMYYAQQRAEDEEYWFEDMQRILDSTVDQYNEWLDEAEEAGDEEKIEEYKKILDILEEMNPYDMLSYHFSYSTPEIEFVEEPYEYEVRYDVFAPNFNDDMYAPYFTYAEEMGYDIDPDSLEYDLEELSNGGDWEGVDERRLEQWLEWENAIHPVDMEKEEE